MCCKADVGLFRRIFQAHGKVLLKVSCFFSPFCLPTLVLHQTNTIHHLQGQGRWHVNPTGQIASGGGKGLGVEDFIFPGGHRAFFLERFDLHESIFIGSKNSSDCHIRSNQGNMHNPWQWIINATFDGTRGHNGHQVDIWNNTFTDPQRGIMQVAVAVLAHDPSRPLFFGRKHTDGNGDFQDMIIEIEQWDTRTPNNNEFQVPRECKSAPAKKPTLFRKLVKAARK